MTLTSLNFFAFFTFIYIVLNVLKIFKVDNISSKIPRIILLLGSYIFIEIIDYRFLICILLFTIITYLISLALKNYKRKVWLNTGIAFCILYLGIFKYFNFFLYQFHSILGMHLINLKLILPIGVSFYTFAAINYLVDIYNNKENVPSFIDYALYISFFPKLTCGPIVRIEKFLKELNTAQISYDNFELGIQKFIIGLFKKIVIADHLAIFVDDVFNYTNAFSSATILLGVFTYSLLIYFDFSGYSDIAIGLSKILGFNFDNNFNLPYVSKNPSEFWKRWHISLSSWLQDYLYIPMGGNRKGKIRTYINLFLTMLIGGLWHGANWTFIIWGGINGIALCIHKFYAKFLKKYIGLFSNSKLYNYMCFIITFLFISFTWIFFRANNISDALNIIKQIIQFKEGINTIYTWSIVGFIYLIIEIYVSHKKNNEISIYYPHLKLNQFWDFTIFISFCGLTIIMAYVGETQFIYGNF